MPEYCPNCSRLELAIQVLEDASRLAGAVARGSPAGVGVGALDFAIRQGYDRRGRPMGGIPGFVDTNIDGLRQFLDNYEIRGQEGGSRPPRKATKSERTNRRAMSAALKEVTAKARKKDGTFRKGWDQKRVMREAHKCRRKM